MRVTTFRGEATVASIVERLYDQLTPNQQKKAETAVIKANPQLHDIQNLREGAILHVPDLPELTQPGSNTPHKVKQSDASLIENLVGELDRFNLSIAEQFDAETIATKAQLTLLTSKQFKRDISKEKRLQQLAGESGKALSQRSDQFNQRRIEVKEAIDRAKKDLKVTFN